MVFLSEICNVSSWPLTSFKFERTVFTTSIMFVGVCLLKLFARKSANNDQNDLSWLELK